MSRRNIFISIALLFVIVFVVIIFRIKIKNNEVNVEQTVNLEDGLQKEELEDLKEEDYVKFSMQDIDDLDLDEVDRYYYFKMWNFNGVFKENANREEREKIYLYSKDRKEAILEMCKKNGNWRLITYTDEFENYNQKDGLLKGFDYDYIEATDYVEGSESDYVDIVAKNNEEERKYRISFRVEDGIIINVNVKLGEVKQINGNAEMELVKVKFDNEHTEENFNNLCEFESAYKGGIDWESDNIGITNDMYSKYPYFLDIFIHYSPLEYNKITLKDLDVESQIAIFEVDSRLECKKRTYEVKYILDDNMYLDDVEVKLLNESVYAGNRSERTNKVLYKHSNWDSLDLTDGFLSKYSSDNGLLPNIDKIDIDVKIKETYVNPNDYYQYIYNLKTKDNKDIYYFVKFDCDNKGNIDNISFEDLPYDSSMTLEEVRDAFLADKELQKELGIEISE